MNLSQLALLAAIVLKHCRLAHRGTMHLLAQELSKR